MRRPGLSLGEIAANYRPRLAKPTFADMLADERERQRVRRVPATVTCEDCTRRPVDDVFIE
jgi:hypothetical protein